MGRRDKRRKRNRHEKVDPLLAPTPIIDDETLWSRIRQKYANIRFRDFATSFTPFGPTVKASTPEELKRKVDEALVADSKKKPDN